MTRLLVNVTIGIFVGVLFGWHQARNNVRFPIWYVVLYWGLLTAGLNMLEVWCGIFP